MKELTSRCLKALIATFCLATTLHSSAQTVKTLAVFDYANGAWPNAALVQATDGNLYGTTQINVFRMTPSGQITSLATFCSTPDCRILQTTMAPLVQGSDGNLYGSTDYGEGLKGGTLFKITPAGTYVLLNFPYGSTPNGLLQGVDGTLYGTTKYSSSLSGTVFKITLSGVLTTMYTFCTQTNCADGLLPIGGLVQASDGNFYGTTYEGGAFSEGTVFKITPTGTFTTLYTFCTQACLDGAHPMAGLVQGNDGDLYGTTSEGGTAGNGTIFKITLDGLLTTLYSFCVQTCSDGMHPTAALVQGSDGNFYGTTNGDPYCLGGSPNCGTLFQVTPSGAFTLLHTFCSVTLCADGRAPDAPLLQATNGTFYGSDQLGGSSAYSQCQIQSCGTMFGLSMGLRPFVEPTPAFGKPGTQIGILGTNLTGTTSVTFNGTPANFTVVSKKQIKAIVPSGATTGWVQVTTPAGTLSSNAIFTVTP